MAGHETRCIIRHSRWKKLTTGSKPWPPSLHSCHHCRAVVQFAFSSRTTFSFRTYFRVRDVVCIMPLCGVFIAHRRAPIWTRGFSLFHPLHALVQDATGAFARLQKKKRVITFRRVTIYVC